MKVFHFSFFVAAMLLWPLQIIAQTFLMERHFGSTGDDGIYDMVVDKNFNVIVTGWYVGNVDLDPGPGVTLTTAFGNRNIMLVKFDSSGNFIWGFGIGSAYQDEGGALAVDSSGNVIVAGRFEGIMDADPGSATYTITNTGTSRDAFVLKYDSSGNLIWAYGFGGTFYDDVEEVVIDAGNNIYLGGSFQHTVDFNPDPALFYIAVSNGIDDAYITKLDSNGVLLWAHTMGGSYKDDVCELKLDAAGNLYAAGIYSGITDFDAGPGQFTSTAQGVEDLFLCKYDTAGNFHKLIVAAGSAGYDAALGLDWLDDKLIITGAFSQVVDFDPGLSVLNKTAVGLTDIFTAVFDTTGSLIWAEQSGGASDDIGLDVSAINSQNIITVGIFQSNAFFNGSFNSFGMQALGGYDVFVSKYNMSGIIKNVFPISSTGQDYVKAVYTMSDSSFYASGFFGGNADFDPDVNNSTNTACSGVNDAYYARYRLNCETINDISSIVGNTVICEADTLMYSIAQVMNAYTYTWSFPASWQVLGQNINSVSVIPMDSGGQVSVTVSNDCSSLISAVLQVTLLDSAAVLLNDSACDGSVYVFPDGTLGYSDTVQVSRFSTVNGCDSVITTHLHFNRVYHDTSYVMLCHGDSLQFNGNVYSVSGNYTDTLYSVLGCDSVIQTLLSVLPQNSFLQNINLCTGDSLVINGNVYFNPGTYIDTLQSYLSCDSFLVSVVNVINVDSSITVTPGVFTANQNNASYQWCECTVFGLTPLPGANGQSLSVPQQGNFAVIVTVSGCADTSGCLSSLLAGTDEFYTENSVLLSPNPVSGDLEINSRFPMDKIEIYGSDGKLIAVFNVSGNYFRMDLHPVPAGIYHLQIIKDSLKFRRRIVKMEN